MATIDQKPIYLMDTPGFDDKKLSDKEVLQQIYEKLQMLSRGDKLIKGMIYLHDMRQTRIGGLAARVSSPKPEPRMPANDEREAIPSL